LSLSWLLGQPIKDSLCGSKALWKADYPVIAEQRPISARPILSGISICSKEQLASI
jgi:hypothetical protein